MKRRAYGGSEETKIAVQKDACARMICMNNVHHYDMPRFYLEALLVWYTP